MKKPDLHCAYVDYQVRPTLECDDVSLTRQEFAEESDINVLMARYERVGTWPLPAPDRVPQYLDLTGVPDFQAAMQLVIDAEASFMRLPATVRRDFDNDPGKFVAFAENPDNLSKMREWGLAAPEVVPDAPQRVEVVNAAPAAPPAPAKP